MTRRSMPVRELMTAYSNAPPPRTEGERHKLYFTRNEAVSQSNHMVVLIAVNGWNGGLRWEIEL